MFSNLPPHLFVSSAGGDLFDTRDPDWNFKPPLRRAYSTAADPIETLSQVKAALRAGPYAWPGGYPLYFVTRDGAALSFDAVRSQFASVADDFMSDSSTGWRVCRVEINYEDSDLRCDHTGKAIPAAHGDDEDEPA
ncbi:DNA ligase [Caulobacter phage CcrPW]|uniref:Uncharacterized protein n=1 Tax=Caulobacter phage CcrPW TaxID=2283271 RepID=A0A385EDQ7_9CAUD|nr:DNA ligase [Caulobacter phage CcrPW]YP_009809622.1 DNA ligase [Caulobacter phage CcrPW]AXQ68542.1 hypothetical protein CcrPW_gp003 [Caulobacter phage CcrPW]AXQ68992.1 hypothetical protein CcrPW_gp453 [Caulobacter phage CcrPW]